MASCGADTPGTTNACSDQHSASVPSAVATETWDQLDFDRACSHPECWLCTELTPWNQAMHGLAFELVELRPGKLRLRSIPRGDIEGHRAVAAAKASFLVSWLLQHHQCIDELKVACGDSSYLGEEVFPIRVRLPSGGNHRRTIRGLEVVDNASGRPRHNFYELQELGAVSGLERLKLDLGEFEPEFGAEVGQLLRRNAGSIKRLHFSGLKLPRRVHNALRYLFSCESLMILLRGGLPDIDPVVQLMHSSTALKELTVGPIASRSHIAAIANELKTNTSLTKLHVSIRDFACCPSPVPLLPLFAALQVNTTLKVLQLTDCCISGVCGQALALLLQKSTSLRLLYMDNAYITESSLVLLAVSLEANFALESLHLLSQTLPINGVLALFKALRVNKTLKNLRIWNIVCSEEVSALLVRQLTQDNCYGRVQLRWADPHLPGLTAVLTSSFPGPEELHLPYIHLLSATLLKQLFDALASNKCVRTLQVCIAEDPKETGRALCKMLRVNRSIQCLSLSIDEDTFKFVEEVSHALAENASITELMLYIPSVQKFETATTLSYLLAHNKVVTKFIFRSLNNLCPKFVTEVFQGMLQNQIVVKFGLDNCWCCNNASFPLFDRVRRNRGVLNQAVHFVVSPSLDRQRAEAFELFAGRSCFLKHLKKVTGKKETEALLGIAAAERYVLDNYLHLTGIVQHSVKCHPANCTQLDALNKECWLAVLCHLKIVDVLI